MKNQTWIPVLLAAALFAPAFPAGAQTPAGTPGSRIEAAAGSASGQAKVARPPAPQAKKAPAKKGPPTVVNKGFFTVSGGYQPMANGFTQTYTWVAYSETATATVAYPVKGSLLFDVSGGWRVWRDLAIGAAFSFYSRTDAGPATVVMPSPFEFDVRRTTQANAIALGRSEAVVHFQATWFRKLAPRLQLAVSGGPSLFRVNQPFVSNVNLDERYPYDTLTVTGFTMSDQSQSKIGFNAGADVTWMLTRQVGVGGLVRFSGASVVFETPDRSNATVHAGGLQVAAGVRARF